MWFSGNFPKDWSHSITVPIYKPGKPTNLSSSYRPISLNSNFVKYGTVIVRRLNLYVERNDVISDFQSGFRSTTNY